MKFVDEYRDAQPVQRYCQAIAATLSRPWTLMEICGGQTHAIVKYGIDQLLPPDLTLIHGPGCPVCVTAVEVIEQALCLARQPDIIFCSFGDMLRVPGHDQDLLTIKAQGGDVRMVYSPLDCLALAQAHPDKSVVFFAVGFETTAPATALAVYQAKQRGIRNFFLLTAHVLVPPAMEALLADPDGQIQGFLAAGHVCTVMGYQAYQALARRYQVPIVVTGFEPLDIVRGIYHCVKQLENNQADCENQYERSVRPEGNLLAQQIMQEVFWVVDQSWRGLGQIPNSGLALSPAYQAWSASVHFADRLLDSPTTPKVSPCISGEILQGKAKPSACPAFGQACTPEQPLGAPMVSSEGACAAYYQYRKIVRDPVGSIPATGDRDGNP
ncbi:hydrogenase formation protein HypD [Synechocystis sp. LKSZ1]|uniref:hydrogenase formation protein HypD n=1 Tax=Synechocystis sp. LKSZ1 TaxID=3144951 RepID=UPI00336C256F